MQKKGNKIKKKQNLSKQNPFKHNQCNANEITLAENQNPSITHSSKNRVIKDGFK